MGCPTLRDYVDRSFDQNYTDLMIGIGLISGLNADNTRTTFASAIPCCVSRRVTYGQI